MNKYILLGAAPFAFAATAAHAEPFSGGYVGAEFGHDNYEAKASNIDFGGATFSGDGISGNGIAGGIYAGYDVPLGGAFAGIEASLGYSDAHAALAYDDGTDAFSAEIRARESYGIAGRLGGKLNAGTGIYAKVGWTRTNFKAKLSDGTSTVSDSDHDDAVVYGAGVETMISERTSLRVEYTIADYGDISLDGASLKNSNVRAGLSFRF